MEHLLRGKDSCFEPSEQFLHWAVKQVEAPPFNLNDPTTFVDAQRALEAYGVCSRAMMPYHGVKIDGNPGHHNFPISPAPTSIQLQAAVKWKHLRGEYFQWKHLDAGAANLIFDRISKLGRVTGVMLPMVSRPGKQSNWETRFAFDNGVVIPFNVGRGMEVEIRAHAVAVAGYLRDTQAPGNGWFVFKNCWGRQYGAHGSDNPKTRYSPAPGWGVVDVEFVDRYAISVWCPLG
jgi:hypothetical protein